MRSRRRFAETAVAVALGVAVVLSGAPAASAATVARPVATGLDFPAAFTFAPDGRVFYGERFTGRIRVRNPATSADVSFFVVPNLVGGSERGLLGLALHPDYPATPWVYAFATRSVAGVARNQVVRLTDAAGQGTNLTVVATLDRATGAHNGGRILFGPDRRLYVVSGDRTQGANSQRLDNTSGKVLRYTAEGAVPPDNPFAGSPIFAYGIRNSFGLGFDPRTGNLWETENGPECNDEVNLVVRGRNLGWGPSRTCSSPPPAPKNTNRDGPNPLLPRLFYVATIAPTGLAFCEACGLGPDSAGRLYVGAFNTGQIRRVTLSADRRRATGQAVAYTHGSPVLSLERGPDGALYFSDPSGIYRLAQG